MKIFKKIIIFFTLMLTISMTCIAVAMPEIYREPPQKLLQGKFYSVVIDRGNLQKAIRDSSGNYLFSEVGAGVKPLVVIGTMPQIVKFLYEKRNTEIRNTIPDLPNVYMSATYYHPKERFEGIFPVQDAIIKVIKSLLTEFHEENLHESISTIADLLNSPKTMQEILNESVLVDSKNKPSTESKLIYLKLSYLKDEGAIEVGKKVVPLASVLNKLLGVKETCV